MSFALALTLALAAPPAARAAPEAERFHQVQKVAEGAWVIKAKGGNVGLFTTAHAAVLVDDQYGTLVPGLLEAVRSVTDRPVRFVVNTHHHMDHVGGNAALEKQVHAVVAHVNVRRHLEQQQAKVDPSRRTGLPTVTFGEEDGGVQARMTLHLDGLDFHLVHYPGGHTDGDVVVGVPGLKVAHLGDLFIHDGKIPDIDVAAGGTLAGMIATLESVLAGLPEDARVIPGQGPVAGKKELARFRDFLAAVHRHVRAHPGKSGADLARGFDRRAFPDFSDHAPFLTWDAFFDMAAGRSMQK